MSIELHKKTSVIPHKLFRKNCHPRAATEFLSRHRSFRSVRHLCRRIFTTQKPHGLFSRSKGMQPCGFCYFIFLQPFEAVCFRCECAKNLSQSA